MGQPTRYECTVQFVDRWGNTGAGICHVDTRMGGAQAAAFAQLKFEAQDHVANVYRVYAIPAPVVRHWWDHQGAK